MPLELLNTYNLCPLVCLWTPQSKLNLFFKISEINAKSFLIKIKLDSCNLGNLSVLYKYHVAKDKGVKNFYKLLVLLWGGLTSP